MDIHYFTRLLLKDAFWIFLKKYSDSITDKHYDGLAVK